MASRAGDYSALKVVRGYKSAIGVDLGIKTLATLSDGTLFENPRALKHHFKEVEVFRACKVSEKERLQKSEQHGKTEVIRRDNHKWVPPKKHV